VAQKQAFSYSTGEFARVDAQRSAHSAKPKAGPLDPNQCLRRLLSENPEINNGNFLALARKNHVHRDPARQFLNDGVRDGTIVEMPGPKRSKLYILVPDSFAPDREFRDEFAQLAS
jgi:hypothetical protein